MIPTISVFERSPDRGMGLSRDMRVRWALEEVGQPYEVRRVPFAALRGGEHLRRQPFGKIPAYEDGKFLLFESGAIVLHIAERHAGLLPEDADARARAIAWIFAALSTVEPPILDCRPPNSPRATSRGPPSGCRWSGTASVNASPSFPIIWAMPNGWTKHSAPAT